MSEKLSFIERLKIWQELLNQPEGTTRENFQRACGKASGVNWVNYDDSSRQDLTYINNLLKSNKVAELVKKKEGKIQVYSLSSSVDLVELYQNEKASRPYQEMLNLLTRMRGFLPEDFLSELSSAYKSISETTEEDEIVVSFETDYSIMADLQYFSTIYKAIKKQALKVTRHRIHKPDVQETVILYPEFLKQYHSEWYVFGIVSTLEGVYEEGICSRIPLGLIDEVEVLPTKSYPFIFSGMDYQAYFDDIIGVECDLNCDLEQVRLRVTNEMYLRLLENPLHGTQTPDKELNRPGYKGVKLTVRKNKELIRKLLDLGKDVEVVAPQKLRNQVARELRNALKYYE